MKRTLLYSFVPIVICFIFFADGGKKKSTSGCIINFDYIDTASDYAKMGNYSVGKFHVKRSFNHDSFFVEITTGSQLLIKFANKENIYAVDTFQVKGQDWHQVYLGKMNIVFSKSMFARKEPTKLYYSWVVANNELVQRYDTVSFGGDTILQNAAESYYYVLKPVDTVRLRGELCYVYTKHDGRNNLQPLGRLYFNYKKGIVRFKSAGDPYAIFDMINFKKSPGCMERTYDTKNN